MSLGKATRYIFLFATFYVIAGATAAYGGSCSSITISVETLAGGATVTGSAGAFSVPLGNVNGLGIGTHAANVSVVSSSSGATYTTPVTVKVVYSGCSGGLLFTIKVYQDSTTSAASQTAARGGATAGTVAAIPTSQATALTISSPANGGSGTITVTRYVGFFVSNANGASHVVGALAPKFIYLFTAQ